MLMSTLLAPLQTATPTGLDVAANLAIIVIALAVVVLALLSGSLLLKLNRAVTEMRIGVRQNLGPVSDRARSISDNVDFITQALRTDVDRLTGSVQSLSDRLQQASDHMEERIDEFNALMEVVQDEAEEIFLDTASTVRGVKEGARAISRPRRPRPTTAPPEENSEDVDDVDRDVEPDQTDP